MNPLISQLRQRITRLTDEATSANPPGYFAQLMDLRIELGHLLCQASVAGVQAPLQTRPLTQTGELPELDVSQLNGLTLASGLQHHGAILVRGLLDSEQVACLQLARDKNDLKPDGPVGCSAAVLFQLLELYKQCGLLNAVQAYMGTDAAVLFGERIKLREHVRSRDKYAAIPWHQDASFFGAKSHAVNVWAAISSCGEDNPGLAVIPRRFEEIQGWDSPELAPLDYGNTMPAELLEKLSDKHPVTRPVFNPGDALMFDEMTMHSTSQRPWRTESQLVAISWFFPASRFPDWGTPLAV